MFLKVKYIYCCSNCSRKQKAVNVITEILSKHVDTLSAISDGSRSEKDTSEYGLIVFSDE